MSYSVERYHDISCGHRVSGHESKCKHLHGHNYRVHFTCESAGLDPVGRVIDFSVVKSALCMWLEENWDHKFLAWERDHMIRHLLFLDDAYSEAFGDEGVLRESIVLVPFNPTAENMARHLVDVVGPTQLEGTGVRLTSVRVEETAKCSAIYRGEK